ncbi:accessory gene regulator B family protein [Paenibacillus sp. Pae108]|uniref:accessory gene regulator B family protein n=1 Tax=Paenibacillus sp. Pae108 TaxID=2926019 RepID=UPI0021184C23|nr:accessory gene regulator B family protein [Paenibacillus sp. Pae108]
MFKVESIADYLANAIHKHDPNASSVGVLRYGLITMINLVITISIVLIISVATGDVLPALLSIAGFPILRYVSGGLHLKSSHMCNVITASFMLISIYTPIEYWYNGFVLNVAAATIIFIYAPTGIKKSTLDPKHYPVLKWIGVGIVSLNFIFQSHVLALVFFIQALTTTKFFNRLVAKFNL